MLVQIARLRHLLHMDANFQNSRHLQVFPLLRLLFSICGLSGQLLLGPMMVAAI